ncbi:MAG: benzylsuccinate synthase beta subunit family protein [Actinobacteria bacterium]|nr:benzylsuccinate synthase beta subunit family protein [Actinomycetota bacterium]
MAQPKARSLDLRVEPGTGNNCKKCKWGIEDPTNPAMGQCIGMKTRDANIWKRLIKDYYNTTCDRFEEGELSFREHV